MPLLSCKSLTPSITLTITTTGPQLPLQSLALKLNSRHLPAPVQHLTSSITKNHIS